jgi:hypothetical protein
MLYFSNTKFSALFSIIIYSGVDDDSSLLGHDV